MSDELGNAQGTGKGSWGVLVWTDLAGREKFTAHCDYCTRTLLVTYDRDEAHAARAAHQAEHDNQGRAG